MAGHADRIAVARTGEVRDTRMALLVGSNAWKRLPKAVRDRFSHHLAHPQCRVYRGRVLQTRLTRIGWLIAQFARLLGSPLPTQEQRDRASTVTVSPDDNANGQLWSRQYARVRGFPQVIHSAKRFSGPTGLEEYVGGGLSMPLRLSATHQELRFHSAGYRIRLFGRQMTLPRFVAPFDVLVRHIYLTDTTFLFDLSVGNRWLGTLIHQTAWYEEMPL